MLRSLKPRGDHQPEVYVRAHTHGRAGTRIQVTLHVCSAHCECFMYALRMYALRTASGGEYQAEGEDYRLQHTSLLVGDTVCRCCSGNFPLNVSKGVGQRGPRPRCTCRAGKRHTCQGRERFRRGSRHIPEGTERDDTRQSIRPHPTRIHRPLASAGFRRRSLRRGRARSCAGLGL